LHFLQSLFSSTFDTGSPPPEQPSFGFWPPLPSFFQSTRHPPGTSPGSIKHVFFLCFYPHLSAPGDNVGYTIKGLPCCFFFQLHGACKFSSSVGGHLGLPFTFSPWSVFQSGVPPFLNNAKVLSADPLVWSSFRPPPLFCTTFNSHLKRILKPSPLQKNLPAITLLSDPPPNLLILIPVLVNFLWNLPSYDFFFL